MNTHNVCQTAFDSAFNKIKRCRDASAIEDYEKQIQTYTDSAFFHFGEGKYSAYCFLMKQCEIEAYNALRSILCSLLKDKHPHSDTVKHEKEFFLILKPSVGATYGFFFKDFGLPTTTQILQVSEIQNKLKQNNIQLNGVEFVCLLSDSAEKAVFNADENTNIISLKDFFVRYLSEEEYAILKKAEVSFTNKVKNYISISIVRTLSPNALFGFKRTVEFNITHFDYVDHIGFSISDDQIQQIKDQYINNKNFKALLGNRDFSISFLTAEWLYDSLKSAGAIDLTSIAMGYFKAIEQFLFAYISLHTKEKEPAHIRNRKIYVIKKGAVTLEDSVVADDKDAITLQSLTSFFGFHNPDTNTIEHRNKDLLCRYIDTDTYEKIVKMFCSITELRNGFFHKDNITVPELVEKARDTAYSFFFLMLGAYKFSERERNDLGLPNQSTSNDFFKLCEYTQYHSNSVYYLSFDDGRKIVCRSEYDDGISYNSYGDITYSGLCLSEYKWAKYEEFIIPLDVIVSGNIDKGIRLEITEQDLLKCNVYVGNFKPVTEGLRFSGAQTIIYDHGHFCAPAESDRPSY